jgi:hypothetical protein
MTQELHDDTFAPFTITADGRCVVASETEWARIEAAATAGVRIAVGDVFAEWDEYVFDNGHSLVCDPFSQWKVMVTGDARRPLTTADIRRRLFSLIDRTAAKWMLETRHPERLIVTGGLPAMLPLKWIANNGINFPANLRIYVGSMLDGKEWRQLPEVQG